MFRERFIFLLPFWLYIDDCELPFKLLKCGWNVDLLSFSLLSLFVWLQWQLICRKLWKNPSQIDLSLSNWYSSLPFVKPSHVLHTSSLCRPASIFPEWWEYLSLVDCICLTSPCPGLIPPFIGFPSPLPLRKPPTRGPWLFILKRDCWSIWLHLCTQTPPTPLSASCVYPRDLSPTALFPTVPMSVLIAACNFVYK